MKIFFAASKNRAMQIRAMENRASRGITVLPKELKPLGVVSSVEGDLTGEL